MVNETVIALSRLCVALAPTKAALAEWGREHAEALASLPDDLKTLIRAAYADRLAVLKETER